MAVIFFTIAKVRKMKIQALDKVPPCYKCPVLENKKAIAVCYGFNDINKIVRIF